MRVSLVKAIGVLPFDGRGSELASMKDAMKMDRRAFLQQTAAAGLVVRRASAVPAPDEQRPEFRTANSRWQAAYDRALDVLAGNVQILPRYSKPRPDRRRELCGHLDGMRTA